MTWQGWLQFALFAVLTTAAVKPLGGHIARSLDGFGRMQRALAPVEYGLYRIAGVDPAEEQIWFGYALAILCFNMVGIVALYALQRLQTFLPFNPQQFDAVSPDLALNTAVSFATNTSWQSYGGETTLSYLSQWRGSLSNRSSRVRPASPWRSHWCVASRAGPRIPSAISGSI
jgi:potassium-transporting ATPase potassium-binding subunit